MGLESAKIYRVRSKHVKLPYYGSTVQAIKLRLQHHKSDYRSFCRGKITKENSVFQIVKHPDAWIELVENFPCKSRKELLKRETYWITAHDCLNKYIPFRKDGEAQKAWREKQEAETK
jgi:hypothetical protein